MSTRQIRDGRKVELYSTYLPNGTLDTPDMSKIVNGNNHKRVLNLLANSKGQTILGGGNDEHKIELTVPKDVPADDPFVKEIECAQRVPDRGPQGDIRPGPSHRPRGVDRWRLRYCAQWAGVGHFTTRQLSYLLCVITPQPRLCISSRISES